MLKKKTATFSNAKKIKHTATGGLSKVTVCLKK